MALPEWRATSRRREEANVPSEIDRAEVQRLAASGAQIVDVMGDAEYGRSHLPGAIHIPLAKIASRAPDLLDAAKPVVVYCYDDL